MITTVSSIACLITTPLILGFLISAYIPDGFEMPAAKIARDIILNLLIPLALGMWILRQFKQFAAPFSRWAIRLSLFIILLIIIGAGGAGGLDLDNYGLDNVALIVVFTMVLMTTSWLFPRLRSLSTPDAIAICMEVTVRNVNLGLLVQVALFAGTDQSNSQMANQALMTVLLYGGLQNLLFLPMVIVGRRMNKKRDTAMTGTTTETV